MANARRMRVLHDLLGLREHDGVVVKVPIQIQFALEGANVWT